MGSDRGRRLSRSGSSGCRSSPRSRPRSSASTCSTRPRSCRRSWCRCGRSAGMVLNRNPDNFFAETEQVAFCTAHVVPGIDFTNDPLLAGRIHSYVDTQISRLGGPNFHEIPINAPIAQVHNNQRDGMHRQAINRGRVAYEPNSLGGGCPFQAGAGGLRLVSGADRAGRAQGARQAGAVRRSLHAGDAVLEQPDAGRAGAHRQRLPLRAVEGADAGDPRAHGLGPDERRRRSWPRRSPSGLGIAEMPAPMPKVLQKKVTPEVTESPSLSLFARPGDGSIRTRRVAILVADGVDGGAAAARSPTRLAADGAVPRFVGAAARHGQRRPTASRSRSTCRSSATPSVLFDARRPAGRRRRGRRARRRRPDAGVPEGPVPPLQADPRARRRDRICSRRRAFR